MRDNEENKTETNDFSNSEDLHLDKYEGQSADSDTHDYQQDDSVLEEDEDDLRNAKKGSSKKLILAGVGVAAVALIGGGLYLTLDEEEVVQPTQSKEKTVEKTNSEQLNNEIKVPETIQINEGMQEVQKSESNNDFNIEPPVVPQQEVIFKDMEKPVEEVKKVEVPLVDPVIEKTETPKVIEQAVVPPVVNPVIEPVLPNVAEKTPEVINPVVPDIVEPVKNITEENSVIDISEPVEKEDTGLIDLDNKESNDLIDPNFETLEASTELNESIGLLIKEMSNVSNNIQDLNKSLNGMNEQILVNKSDIESLMKRVEDLEKLHKDKDGNMVSCVSACSSDGKVALVAPIQKVKSTPDVSKKVVKKPIYKKPANKIEVVSKSGDLSKSTNSKPKQVQKAKTGTSQAIKLESVVGDRAWVRTQNGSIKSYGINDILPNGKKIGNIDSSSGVFDVNGHLVLTR